MAPPLPSQSLQTQSLLPNATVHKDYRETKNSGGSWQTLLEAEESAFVHLALERVLYYIFSSSSSVMMLHRFDPTQAICALPFGLNKRAYVLLRMTSEQTTTGASVKFEMFDDSLEPFDKAKRRLKKLLPAALDVTSQQDLTARITLKEDAALQITHVMAKASTRVVEHSTSVITRIQSAMTRKSDDTSLINDFILTPAMGAEQLKLFCSLVETMYKQFYSGKQVDKLMNTNFVREIPQRLAAVPVLPTSDGISSQGDSRVSFSLPSHNTRSLTAPIASTDDPQKATISLARAHFSSSNMTMKRIPNSVNDEVAKFVAVDSNSIAAATTVKSKTIKAVCRIDRSAAFVLANVNSQFLSYLSSEEHQKNFGAETPRRVFFLQGEGRAQLVSLVEKVRMPGLNVVKKELFELYTCWDVASEEVDGFKGFRFCIMPKATYDELHPTKNEVVDKFFNENPMPSPPGVWKCLYTLTELAPDVCELTLDSELSPGKVRPMFKNVEALQAMFQRNGKEVDKEVRRGLAEVIQSKGARHSLSEDQLGFVQEVKEVIRATSEETERYGWTKITSPSPFVEMRRTKSDTVKVALCSAKTIIDCHPAEVIAWNFDYCSKERMRISAEEGNPARICVEKRGATEAIFATIKSFPLILSDREFVVRQIWNVEDDGKVVELYCASIPLEVDYGIQKNKKNTRAFTQFLLRAELVEDDMRVVRSKVELLQYLDPAGSIPQWVVNLKLPQVLGVVMEALDEFKQDEAVDREALEVILNDIKRAGETYTAEEDEIVSNLMLQAKRFSMSKLDDVSTPDRFLRVQSKYAGNGQGLAKGTIIIDATVEELAAIEYLAESREMTTRFEGRVQRRVNKISKHAQLIEQVRNLEVPGVRLRTFSFKVIWKKLVEGEYTVVHSNTPLDDELKIEEGLRKGQFIRARTETVAHFQSLPELNGVPQTKLTYYLIEVDMRGHIPMPLVHSNLASFFSTLSLLRKKYDRSAEIDTDERRKMVDVLLAGDRARDEWSEEEKGVLAEGLDLLKEFDDVGGVEFEAAHLEGLEAFATLSIVGNDSKRKKRWGKIVSLVRAPPEHVVSYLVDVSSRGRKCKEDVERETKVLGDHSKYTFHRFKTGAVFDSFNLMVWKEDDVEYGDFIVCSAPSKVASKELSECVTSHKLDNSTKLVEMAEYFKVQAEGEGTRVTHLVTIDDSHWGYGISEALFYMRTLPLMSVYFWKFYEFREWEEVDGSFLGKLFMHEYATMGTLEDLWHDVASLKEVGERYKWLQSFVEVLCANKLLGHLYRSLPVKSNLDAITAQEGMALGARFAPHLAMNLIPSGAVDEYILCYGALQELEAREEKWFRSFLGVLAADLLAREPWGLKLRLLLGAGLSIVDVATDIFMAWTYFDSEEEDARQFGISICIMLGLSIAAQSVIAIVQNKKKNILVILRELLYVISFIKPGVDAARVSSEREDPDLTFDVMTELIMHRIVKLFADSIPGSILQTYALVMLSGGRSTGAYFSVIVSLLTTGVIGATISYDFDINPTKRLRNPEFYGYISDDASLRAVCFILMMLNSALMLATRALAASLLVMTDSTYLLMAIFIDHALYMGQKFIRRDYTYWVPIEGILSLVFSFFCRFIVKLVVDFTGIVQFRHPYEMGGLYWSLNMVVSNLGCWASVHVYSWTSEDLNNGLKTESLFRMLGILTGLQVVNFICFLGTIKRKYLHTFFSTETGVTSGQKQFLEGKSNAAKSAIFTRNEVMWRPIERRIRAWLEDGWLEWVNKKPEWFNEKFRSTVPVDMMPDLENLESLRLQSGLTTLSNVDSAISSGSSSLSTFGFFNPSKTSY
ncbi:hypothetical protein TrLO_g6791 [Triparma laevis f. longispina]|uniref:Uncharacterized protein n=1 Tax=Triparma laevis f. longispina TaxID=1714387 RepID=A0A9W7FJW8_9STRA|nr:hypothetical protein TrLO_g6791 [Triparma laevis f. longispina]